MEKLQTHKRHKKHINMGSIPQFREVVRNVKRQAQYIGQDENDESIYDSSIKLPIIKAVGYEKLHGCFEKNSLVSLANGESIPISKIKEGTYVLTYNEKTNKVEPQRVIKSLCRKLDKEWCKLIFDKTEIICTKDHKIFTKNRGYVEAYKLSVNDEIKSLR